MSKHKWKCVLLYHEVFLYYINSDLSPDMSKYKNIFSTYGFPNIIKWPVNDRVRDNSIIIDEIQIFFENLNTSEFYCFYRKCKEITVYAYKWYDMISMKSYQAIKLNIWYVTYPFSNSKYQMDLESGGSKSEPENSR